MGKDPCAALADILARMEPAEEADARRRIEALSDDRAVRLAGVIGWPLTHTLSPTLHNYWCQRHDVEGAYLRLPISPENFRQGVEALKKTGFRGVNVTIPFKEEAFRLSDRVTELARLCGSVNTLTFEKDGSIVGDSTDGDGFCENVVATGETLAGPALVLGAGGAARAICAALQARGLEVWVTNRTEARAHALADGLPGLRVMGWADWSDQLGRFRTLINTTSLGMAGAANHDWMSALAMASRDLLVCDIVYVPLETELLRAARARKLTAVDGLGMLIEQARVGFRAWFGVDPRSDAATRHKLLEALG